ncbi:MAG: S1 family peptidase [Nitrososphaera sp.]
MKRDVDSSKLFNKDILSKVKLATVAIGLVDRGKTRPKTIAGSGFIISEKRYVASALHVVESCLQLQSTFRARGEETHIAAFHADSSKEGVVEFQYLPFAVPLSESIVDIKMPEMHAGWTQSLNLDIGIAKLMDHKFDLPFLEFKEPTAALQLYDEVVMCGYPSGDQSLNVTRLEEGIRFDPILQFGRISNFLPTDNSPNALGIQTDIVATAGSSGSPIVDPNDGAVVAIAQKVIPTFTTLLEPKGYGLAKIGLVYGASHYLGYVAAETAMQWFATGKRAEIQAKVTGLLGPAFGD